MDDWEVLYVAKNTSKRSVGTLHDSKLQKEYFVVLLQFAECILLHF